MSDDFKLNFFNPHWSNERISVLGTQRDVLAEIYSDLDMRQIHFLVGATRKISGFKAGFGS